jgi:hypothetical protein
MKTKLPVLTLALALASCSTAQIQTAQAIVDPVAVAFVSGYAQSYGVPPALTSSILTPIMNDGWGLLAQKQAGNPIAQGAAIPTVGTAVAATNPTASQLVSAIGTLTLAKSNPQVANALLAGATATKSSAWPGHRQSWFRRLF